MNQKRRNIETGIYSRSLRRQRKQVKALLMGLIVGWAITAGTGYHMLCELSMQQTDTLNQLMELRQSVEATEAPSSAPKAEQPASSLGTFEITHYCTCSRCCGAYANGITATGTRATPGRTAAVDPAVIPYGTVIRIDGKEYIAEDCGAAIQGRRIDLLCESHEAALQAGRYTTEVIRI